jgi:hypothetical protein
VRPASAASASASAQTVTLSASVVSFFAGVVNGGTVTFTVSGIGSATSGTVTNGAASATLIIPAGTKPGNYTIAANYSGTQNFSPSSTSNASQAVIGAPVAFGPVELHQAGDCSLYGPQVSSGPCYSVLLTLSPTGLSGNLAGVDINSITLGSSQGSYFGYSTPAQKSGDVAFGIIEVFFPATGLPAAGATVTLQFSGSAITACGTVGANLSTASQVVLPSTPVPPRPQGTGDIANPILGLGVFGCAFGGGPTGGFGGGGD